jgi:hypothetical protein
MTTNKMKKLVLLSAFLLAGCATIDQAIEAYEMKFDSNQYQLITDIRTLSSIAKNNCGDIAQSKAVSVDVSIKSLTLMNYAEHNPHNSTIQKSSIELNSMVQDLSDKYKAGAVSPIFCKIKFQNIEQAANTMQRIEGSKPK